MPVLPATQNPAPKSVYPDENDTVLMTPDEYILSERASAEKHDYINGKVVLRVAGTSPEHNRIQHDISFAFDAAINAAGLKCEVFGSDIKVFIKDKLRLYPDAIIACGHAQFDDKDTLHNPALIIEVLSKSTRDYDKGDKFKHYQTINSLRHYVLIEQDRVEVLHYEKQADGSWMLAGTYADLSDELPIHLDGTQVFVPSSRIYRRVSFED